MAHDHPVPATDRASMLVSCPANAPPWEPELPYPQGLAGEIEHPRHLALRHDEPYIQDLHARRSSGIGEWVETWGFLLTADEELLLHRHPWREHPPPCRELRRPRARRQQARSGGLARRLTARQTATSAWLRRCRRVTDSAQAMSGTCSGSRAHTPAW